MVVDVVESVNDCVVKERMKKKKVAMTGISFWNERQNGGKKVGLNERSFRVKRVDRECMTHNTDCGKEW